LKSRTHVVGEDELARVLERRDFHCDLSSNYKFAKEHNWSKAAELTEGVYADVSQG